MTVSYRAIVIGASAGAISALEKLLSALPETFPVPIIVVHHVLPNAPSELWKLLGDRTKLTVKEIIDKEPIESGIYTSPSNYHVLINDDYTFSLSVDDPVRFSRPSIDVSFESASDVYGASLIGIVLSGNNEDGSRGLKKIIENGGLAIVEDPKTAEFPTMPQSALKATKTGNVFTLEEMPVFLVSLLL